MNTTKLDPKSKSEAQAPGVPRRRSWLWRVGRFCLLGIVTLVTLYFLFRVEEDWRGKRAWKHYKEAMEAKGVVFDLQELVPPPVPDDQNFAMTPLLKPIFDMYPPGATNASRWRDEEGKKRVESVQVEDVQVNDRILGRPLPDEGESNSFLTEIPGRGDWRLGKQVSLQDWQKYYRESELFPSWPEPRTPAEDVLKALSRYDAELAELQEASKRPHARFNIFYEEENPAAILLPHLKVLRSIAKVIQLRAIAELEADDAEAAFKDVQLLLTLSNSIESEPTLISYLVRIALLSLTEETVWEGLVTHRWTESQLMEFQRQFSEINLVSELKRAMESERAWGTEIFEWMIRKPEALLEVSDPNPSEAEKMIVQLIPPGWICFEAINYNRLFDYYYIQVLPDSSTNLDVEKIKAASEAFDRDMERESNLQAFLKHRVLMRMLMPALRKLPPRSVHAEAFKDMTVIAIAAERYYLAHQAYPESLDELVPQYLAHLPLDPVSHKPFHYERTNDGMFRLWSVGWDEENDGGVVALRPKERGLAPEQGDWVWPQPEGMKTEVVKD